MADRKRPELAPFEPLTEPLPGRFQLGTRGLPVPIPGTGGAAGAGGGCGEGTVDHGPEPADGAVLVVATLDAGLAPLLPRLSGLVAETGSVLAHAAILAREMSVPTVVGLAGAREQFPPGTRVRVDGNTGDVVVLEEAQP